MHFFVFTPHFLLLATILLQFEDLDFAEFGDLKGDFYFCFPISSLTFIVIKE